MPQTTPHLHERLWKGLLACCASVPLLAGCAGLARQDQGLLQPQSVDGPCDVKKFFLVRLSTTRTTMRVANSGGACVMSLLNPDQQVVLDAALITERPAHGQAAAGLTNGARSALVSYTPQPGYAGPDGFHATLQPGGIDVAFTVEVQAAAAP